MGHDAPVACVRKGDGGMGQAVSYWPVTMETQVHCKASHCGICGGQSSTGTDSSLSTLVCCCQYHFANNSYQFIHLTPVVYKLSS
jgi:hypothetical protein